MNRTVWVDNSVRDRLWRNSSILDKSLPGLVSDNPGFGWDGVNFLLSSVLDLE